jgi:hypothetical protein
MLYPLDEKHLPILDVFLGLLSHVDLSVVGGFLRETIAVELLEEVNGLFLLINA